MPIYELAPASSAIAIFVIGALAFIFREAFRAWITSGIQAKFDSDLERLKSELQREETQLHGAIKKSEARLDALRNSIQQGTQHRRHLISERRIRAAEVLWEAVTNLQKHKSSVEIMAQFDFQKLSDEAPSNQGIQRAFRMVTGMPDEGIPTNLAELANFSQGDSERPFVTEPLWASFSAYRSVISSAWIHAALVALGVAESDKFMKRDHLKGVLLAALPNSKSEIEKSDVLVLGQKFLDRLEELVVADIRSMLEGTEIDKANLERSAKLLEATENLNAERDRMMTSTAS